ncbi:MAG: JAB domain-containing protein [Minisyncoccia bacterium]
MNTIKLNELEKSLELAEVKVIYKRSRRDAIKIINSKDCFEILYSLFNKDIIEYREEFFLLLINRASNLLGWIKLSIGGTTGTVVDPKIVFTLAVQTNACSIVLCHNHPSGNLCPSQEDITLTERIKNGGKLLDIKLLDHLIITPDGSYYSFTDDGLL